MKLRIRKLNEDLITIANQLNSKLKGRLTYNIPNPIDYKNFNIDYNNLIKSYELVLSSLNYNIGLFTFYSDEFYDMAYKNFNIKKHVFSFQIDLFINELKSITDIIHKDLIEIRNFSKNLLESLDAYFHRQLNYGYLDAQQKKLDFSTLQNYIIYFKNLLINFYNNNELLFSDTNKIIIENIYISIQYHLNELNNSLNKRIYELNKDYLISLNI